MTDKAEWLAGLKVGDPVRLRFNTSDAFTLHRVAGFTKMRIVLDSDDWFRRADGRTPSQCGCHWWQIEKPTTAQAGKVKR